ncbi:MAG: TOMM precursor leader peptide-binding protein [Minicystis sp.]
MLLRGAARFAHEARVMSLSATLDGLDAVLGPAVVPGRTACWDCARRRQIANAARPHLLHALHDSLLETRLPSRERIAPAPAAGMLGHAAALAAIELLRLGAAAPLVGKIAVQSLTDLQTTRYTVLPMPACALCGGAKSMNDEAIAARVRLDAARDPAELRGMLAGVVDKRYGIIRDLMVASQDSPYAVEVPITAVATLGSYSACAHHDHEHEPEDGSGKGITVVDAMIGAVGEAVERYSANYFDPERLVRAPVAAMKGDFLAPERLDLYAESQYAQPGFPYPRLDPATPIDWTPGRWLDTGEPVYLPALLTYYGYPAHGAESFCQVTSNGLAAGPTLEDASLRALLELVERDAFTLTWLLRRPARRVAIDDTVDVAVREMNRKLVAEAGAGGRSVAYLLDVGIRIPVVMSVVFGDGVRWPGASIALSAHLSPRAAIRKALLEQGQIGPFYRRLLEEQKPIPERPEDVHTLEDHALYYFPVSRAGAFDFLAAGGVVAARELEEPADVSLPAAVARVREAGLRIAVADVTSPDLRGFPFRVVRAIGPDLQQIHFGHRVPRLGNPRLLAMLGEGTINPDPHPLD